MAIELDVTQLVLELIGGKLDVSGGPINALPVGSVRSDFKDWQGPVSYPETFNVESCIFHSDVADVTFTPRWEYNGQYIANFDVLVEGNVARLSNVKVQVQTLDRGLDNGVAQLEYHIIVKYDNLLGGMKTVTYRAVARGDGGGMSLG